MQRDIRFYLPKYLTYKYISSDVGREYMLNCELYLCAAYVGCHRWIPDQFEADCRFEVLRDGVIEDIYLNAEDIFENEYNTLTMTDEYREEMYEEFTRKLTHDINGVMVCHRGQLYEYLFVDHPDNFEFLLHERFSVNWISNLGNVYMTLDPYNEDDRGVYDDIIF